MATLSSPGFSRHSIDYPRTPFEDRWIRGSSPRMTNSASSRIQRHMRLDDLVGILDRLAALDLVDVLHARGHLAPHRVLLVEERGIVEADEKLAIARIGIGGARHRGGAAHMRLGVEFGLELLAGAAGTG